jgi:hypothetical protein
MKRRVFAGSLGAAIVPALGSQAGGQPGGGGNGRAASTRLLELRRYRMRVGPMEPRFSEHVKATLLPAYNRAGLSPVGAFTVMVGADSPTLLLLLEHASPEALLGLDARLEADAAYQKASAAFRSLPPADPPFVRLESSLSVPFRSTPGIERPKDALAVPTRVFELRTYESHNRAAGRKKIEMFEEGGEIAIFRRVGITPVFFARDLIGTRLPSLTYMAVFADMPARDKAWAAFRDDPEWVKLRSTPGFTNAEILSNTSITLLRPTDYSQL